MEQPRKIESVSVSTASRRGYQTQQFDVDNLFNGLIDKQNKQNHFHSGGTLNKAPKSKRPSKNKITTISSASQPVPEKEPQYDITDFYSQGSAISDDEAPIDSEQQQTEISECNSNVVATQMADSLQTNTNTQLPTDDDILQGPLFQHVQELVASGQIIDLESHLSALFTSILANFNSTYSFTSTNVNLGPLTRILSRVK